MGLNAEPRTALSALLGLVLLAVVLVAVSLSSSRVSEFRGTLRTGVVAIGGETTGVVLITATGSYELDLPRNVEWGRQLTFLDGKPVVVTGRLTIGKGIERRQRRIVRVQSLLLDNE